MATELLYIDLFCGAGGTSTGVERARLDGRKCARVNFLSKQFGGDPQGKNIGVDGPAPTLTTKDRVAVVLPHSAEQCIPACEISPEDTPAMCRIKEFCALYGIVDITMRMLRIAEMKRIQGFGDDYVLVGTQEEQKKYLGNAVVTQVATAMCEALAGALTEQKACRKVS